MQIEAYLRLFSIPEASEFHSDALSLQSKML